MQANKSRDTSAELKVRTLLHKHGLRYRVDIRPEPELRRRADIVFTKARIAIFIDGCFWHGCPDHYVEPKTNASYWKQKISGNVTRDLETTAQLERRGWTVLRFWSHTPSIDAATKIESAVRHQPANDV